MAGNETPPRVHHLSLSSRPDGPSVSPLTLLLALGCMLAVRRGEAVTQPARPFRQVSIPLLGALKQAQRTGAGDGLGAVACAELAEDVVEVGLHCADRDDQSLGDNG